MNRKWTELLVDGVYANSNVTHEITMRGFVLWARFHVKKYRMTGNNSDNIKEGHAMAHSITELDYYIQIQIQCH